MFRPVNRHDIPRLLDEIEGYCDNERFSREQFEKYLFSEKGIDSTDNSMFYGLFDNGKCLALAYLNKVPEDFILMAQVSSVVRGYGKPLIENIIEMSRNLWWAADPDGGEKLVDYYRQFGMKEVILDNVKWVDGRSETFFYKAATASDEVRLLAYLEAATV